MNFSKDDTKVPMHFQNVPHKILILIITLIFYYTLPLYNGLLTKVSSLTLAAIFLLLACVNQLKSINLHHWLHFGGALLFTIRSSPDAIHQNLLLLLCILSQVYASIYSISTPLLRFSAVAPGFAFFLYQAFDLLNVTTNEAEEASCNTNNKEFAIWAACFLFSLLIAKERIEVLVRLKTTAENEFNTISTNYQKLVQRLQQQDEKIIQITSELGLAIAARDSSINSFSHEFRNPLNVILGNLELLIMEATHPKSVKMLEASRNSCQLLLSLVNNVLDAGKIISHQLEMNKQPTQIFSVVKNLKSAIAPNIISKKLTASISIDKEMPKVIELDKHRFLQICFNVIGNSTKFTSKGFLKVHFSWIPSSEAESRLPDRRGFEERKDDDELERVEETLMKPSSSLLELQKAKPSPELRELLEKEEMEIPTNKQHRDDNDDDEEEEPVEDLAQFNENIVARSPKKKDSRIKSMSELNRSSVKSFYFPITPERNSQRRKMKLPLTAGYLQKPSLGEMPDCGFLKLECLDSGSGMSSSTLQNLFRPFRMEDASITRKHGGVGLGLFIAHELVNLMGGRISIDSELGTGTRTCILLPTRRITSIPTPISSLQNVNAPISRISAAASFPSRANVLIVDDSSYNVEVLRGFFKKFGFQSISTAFDGQEAIKIYESHPSGHFSLITMDLQMPIMDGFTACRAIRDFEANRKDGMETPIVIISGNCSKQEQDLCLNREGDIRAIAFYRKPVSLVELEACISKIFKPASSYPVSISEVGGSRPELGKKKVLLLSHDSHSIRILGRLLQNYDELEFVAVDSADEIFQYCQRKDLMLKYVVFDCDHLEFCSALEKLQDLFAVENFNELGLRLIAICDEEFENTDKLKNYGFERILTKPLRVEQIKFALEIESLISIP